MAQLNFDATNVAPDTGFGDPIPAGWYNMRVVESDLKPTKDNASTGNAYLAVQLEVIDGEYAKRRVFTNFNLKNTNPVAQEIAYKQLSALAHAVGVLVVQDSQQLHGIPFKAQVKVREGSVKNAETGEKYDPSNVINQYKNINENVAGASPAVPGVPGAPGGMPPGFGTAQQAAFTPPVPGGPGAPVFTPPPAAAPAFVPPPVAPPAPVAAAFPPEGWIVHPSAPGYFYMGQEVLDEAALRARYAAPAAAPVAPPVPAAPVFTPPAAAAPVAAPAAPAGQQPPWAANPAGAQTATPPWARPAA